jgi:hypothetical protein
VLLAIGLVLTLIVYRAVKFHPGRFDNRGGTAYPNRAAPESNSAGDPAQGAGIGDVGGVRDHP